MVSYGFPFVLSLTFLHFVATTVNEIVCASENVIVRDLQITPDIYGICYTAGLLLILRHVHAAGTASSIPNRDPMIKIFFTNYCRGSFP
jgi:hypothetical protein